MMPNVTATSLRLTPSQIYFLDGFRARVRRDTGCRIPRAKLVQALVDAIAEIAPDLGDLPVEGSGGSAEGASSVTLRISNESVFKLQLLAAELRYRSGRSVSYSAIVRGLVAWMSERDLDTRQILELDDLRVSLLRSLSLQEAHAAH